MPVRATLYYDFKQGLKNPEVAEARRRAESVFGAENLRLEGFDYRPAACAADEIREGGPLSLSTFFGRFRGLGQIRRAFPLPEDAKKYKSMQASK